MTDVPARLAAILCAASALAAFVCGATQLERPVSSLTIDSVRMNAGTADGVRVGTMGRIERDGTPIADVEVIEAAEHTSLLRIVVAVGAARPRPGDRIVLTIEPPEAPEATPVTAPPAATSDAPNAEGSRTAPSPVATKPAPESKIAEEPFTPLLAPYPKATEEDAGREPVVSHGRVYAREAFQIDSESDLGFSRTRVGTDGGIDRLGDGRWFVDWSGEVSYRSGGGFHDSPYDDDLRLYVYRLGVTRKFEDGGTFRVGRFLPLELPAVGYLDGLFLEEPVGGGFRVGAMGGFKPDRMDLAPSFDEPTAVVYGAIDTGKRQTLYYAGTLGILGSAYKGKFDRLALLFDQRADIGSHLSLYSTAQIDFDTGAFETRSGTRITHLDLYGVSPIASFLTLRAGLDRYERPDTRAERDLLPVYDPLHFDGGYWRYWVGGSQYLPWNLTLDEELAFIDAKDEDMTPRWRVALTRLGIFSWTNASVSATVYNLDGAEAEGYGGLLSAYLPFLDNRLSFRPNVGFRALETDDGADSFDMTDASLYADWWLTRSWRLYAGASYLVGDALDRTLVDIGVEFKW